MEDKDKSQKELIKELTALRQRVAELEVSSSSGVEPSLENDNVTRTTMGSEFIGREASCRYLVDFFQALQKKGLSPETLTEGVDYSLEHLLTKEERIDWSSYRTIMANAGNIWSDEELVGIGRTSVKSPWMKHFKVVARLLLTSGDFYRWGHQFFNRGSGAFSCGQSSYRQLGSNHFLTEITMQNGYEPRREIFLIIKGIMIAMPTVLGLKDVYGKVDDGGQAEGDPEDPAQSLEQPVWVQGRSGSDKTAGFHDSPWSAPSTRASESAARTHSPRAAPLTLSRVAGPWCDG